MTGLTIDGKIINKECAVSQVKDNEAEQVYVTVFCLILLNQNLLQFMKITFQTK